MTILYHFQVLCASRDFKNNELVYIIYKISTGISHTALSSYFDKNIYTELYALCEKKIIKESSNVLLPFHDIYISAFNSYKSDLYDKTLEKFVLFAQSKGFITKSKMFAVLIDIGKECLWKYRKEASEYRDTLHNNADYYGALEIAKMLKNSNKKNISDYSLEDCQNQFVLANCIKYTFSYDEANKEFEKIKSAYYSAKNTNILSLYLESQTEIINNHIWMLNINQAITILGEIETLLYELYEKKQIVGHHMIYAFLNYYNRIMFIKFMIDKGCESDFENAIKYSEEMNQIEYIAFAKMDYAKCLYNQDLDTSKELLIKRLGVFTFDEETNILIPVVTEYDTVSNTLTAEVDTQGTYLLIDMEKWLDEWDIADTSSALVRIPNIAVASSAVQTNSSARERGRPHDVAFLLQCSTVNEYSLEKDKKLIENLCSQLFYDYSDINIYIVKYYNDYNQTNFVKIHDDSYALHSISEVKAALALCKYGRCLSYVRRSIAMDRIMNTIGNRHMHYDYIFDLMNGYTYAPYRSDTRLLFEKYNTMYSEISLGHYDYDDDQQFYEQFFADYGSLAIYDIGNSDIKLLDAQNKMYEFMTGHPFQSVSYISSLNLRKLDLKHPLEVNGTTDSDSDGLTDWEEVFNEGNLITHDGTHITALPTYEKYVNYALRNTDRAESIRTFIRKKIGVGRYDIVKNIKVLPLKSDPKKKDTDGDGVDDNDDYTPTITASNLSLYKIVDDFDNFNFFDSFVGEYKRRQEEIADSTYRSIRLSQEEMIELKIKKQFAYLYVIGGQGVFAGSNAAWALSWYLSENGLDRKISTIGMISFLLTGSGKLHYQTELSSVSDFAKNVLKDGDTIVLVSSKPFTSYKKNECLVNAMEDPELIINNVNWAATLGDSSGALVAEVTRHGNTYSMKYRYLIYDYYDWDLGNDWGLFEDIPGLNNLSVTDSEFAMMHYTGIARAYFQYGELKGSFTYSDFLEPYQGIPFIYYDYDQEEAEICLP